MPDAAVHYEDCGVAHALAFGVLGGVFGGGVVDVDGADVAGGADGDEAAAADVDVLDGAAVGLVGVVELAERGLERAAVEDLALEGGVIRVGGGLAAQIIDIGVGEGRGLLAVGDSVALSAPLR